MKLNKFLYSILLSLICYLPSFGQSIDLKEFTLDDFLAIVKEHHPVAKQAEIELKFGEAFHLTAKGAFDPIIYSDIAQKNFKGTSYYNINNVSLKVPTWIGVDFYAGYEQTGGVYLNPELTTPASGLAFAGISIPIAQGLIIDKRRVELKKARLFKDITENERKLILNDLILDAGEAYWDWFDAYNVMKVNEEGVILAKERFEFVTRSAKLGDVPYIDTLEASIQLQNREIELQNAKINFIKNTFLLNNFLWKDGLIPLELDENTIPLNLSKVDNKILTKLPNIFQIDSLAENHPEIIQSDLKIDQLEVEKRWRREQIKPILNLKYNFLTEPVNNNPLVGINTNDYKAGLEFAMPIFLRKERGNLKLINLELESTNLELQAKILSIKNKSKAALNEYNLTSNQVELYSRVVRDSKGLLDGERRKFEVGESSIFLVNTRETSYLSAKIKQVNIVAKNKISNLKFQHSLVLLID